MMTSDSGGPHVQVAAFCEKAIVEQGTGTLSLIGLVEKVTNTAIGPGVPDVMPPFSLDAITLAVCLWADQARGRYAIKVRPEDPSGYQMDSLTLPIQLEGGPRGVNLITKMSFPVEHEGTYWFDILFSVGQDHDDRLLSRLPLEVIYRPQQTA
jgi:hypothetical protein